MNTNDFSKCRVGDNRMLTRLDCTIEELPEVLTKWEE